VTTGVTVSIVLGTVMMPAFLSAEARTMLTGIVLREAAVLPAQNVIVTMDIPGSPPWGICAIDEPAAVGKRDIRPPPSHPNGRPRAHRGEFSPFRRGGALIWPFMHGGTGGGVAGRVVLLDQADRAHAVDQRL